MFKVYFPKKNKLLGVPKKVSNRKESKPKLSSVGLSFTMDMTWDRLILLSISEKQPKNIFQA